MKRMLVLLPLLLLAAGCGEEAAGEQGGSEIDRAKGYRVSLPAELLPGAAQNPPDTPTPSPSPCVPEPTPTPTPGPGWTLPPGCPLACLECKINTSSDAVIPKDGSAHCSSGSCCPGCPFAAIGSAPDEKRPEAPTGGLCVTPTLFNYISCCVPGSSPNLPPLPDPNKRTITFSRYYMDATWNTDNPDCEEGKGTQRSGYFHAGRNEFADSNPADPLGNAVYHICKDQVTAVTAAAQARAQALGFCFLNIRVGIANYCRETGTCRKNPATGTETCDTCTPHTEYHCNAP